MSLIGPYISEQNKGLIFPRQETSVTLAARAEASQPVNLAAGQTVGVDLAHCKVPLIILDQLHPSCHLRLLIIFSPIQVSLVGAGGQTVSLLSSPGGHGGLFRQTNPCHQHHRQ